MTADEWGNDSDYEAEVMGGNAKELQEAIVGHRIVGVDKAKPPKDQWWGRRELAVRLTLDDGREVFIEDTDDCCAFTEVEDFKFLEGVDNAVTSVTTEDGFSKWFIYADSVPVVDLKVAWSPGNPYYYGFGFNIIIKDVEQKEEA
jgi:hypothetical protein